MHMFDAGRRFMGGYAIVGESCPIAVGIAYAVAMRKGPEAVVCFFGDGAVNQGTFHESLNMAALWRLPLLFVCQNNHYAIGTEIHRHSAVVEVYKRAAAYNIPAERIDGMDVLKVYEATHRALERIRSGGGPQFLEAQTYRYRGHSMADPGTYRPAVEVKAQEARDPIAGAIREAEYRYPTQAELVAVGPDNISRLTSHMVRRRRTRIGSCARPSPAMNPLFCSSTSCSTSERGRWSCWPIRRRCTGLPCGGKAVI
jgi:pyruvate dehydrogenase E1 component alpha subunit